MLTQRERLTAVLTAWRLQAERHERAAEEIDGEADPWEKLMHEREAELLHRCRDDILAVIGPGWPQR